MSANVSSEAQRKRKEKKNADAVRTLQALSANKECFECGQRESTYANVTEGSFCCLCCSGLLRDLKPPHGVKSISIETFTDEEVRKLRQLGNEGNAKIWLGLHDGKVKLPKPRVEGAVKQHIIQKYVNKRWYVSPAEPEELEPTEKEKEFEAATGLLQLRGAAGSESGEVAAKTEPSKAIDLSAKPKSTDADAAADGGAATDAGTEAAPSSAADTEPMNTSSAAEDTSKKATTTGDEPSTTDAAEAAEEDPSAQA